MSGAQAMSSSARGRKAASRTTFRTTFVRIAGPGAYQFFVVATIVLVASLFGIFTRPAGQLAAFWPANAVFLGILVRYPDLAGRWGWLGGIAGLLAADIATGGSVGSTLLLTAANVAGVAAGYPLLRRLDPVDRQSLGPRSILQIGAATLLASALAGLVGALINPILFGGGALDGLFFWGATELVNYVAILPAVLALPSDLRPRRPAIDLASVAPVATLLASIAIAAFVDGPGTLAFPLPGLLWCAMIFSPFATALMTLLATAIMLLSISTGLLALELSSLTAADLVTIRLGVTLMAFGPLVVAGVTMAHRTLRSRLQDLADRDLLTGSLTRRAFRDRAALLLSGEGLALPETGAALLLLDLDHFKRTNDTFGHNAGDMVLQAFAVAVGRHVRAADLFGRWGGEEFAVFLASCPPATAVAVAERIRCAVAGEVVVLDDGREVPATVSIGVVTTRIPADLDRLLELADRALYRAKQHGRNRVEVVSDAVAATVGGNTPTEAADQQS